MARWYRRYRRYGGYSRRGRKWSPSTQVVNTTTAGGQKSQAIVYNRMASMTNPENTGVLVSSIGPIMKVKNFRINVVSDSPVTVLWALVYVPDGLPIGRLDTGLNVTASGLARSLYEPQQFIIASGLY